jgi:hypothetical protein
MDPVRRQHRTVVNCPQRFIRRSGALDVVARGMDFNGSFRTFVVGEGGLELRLKAFRLVRPSPSRTV